MGVNLKFLKETMKGCDRNAITVVLHVFLFQIFPFILLTSADECKLTSAVISKLHEFSFIRTVFFHSSMVRIKAKYCVQGIISNAIDGLHLTSRRSCWRYNTKEYVISSIVGSSRRGRYYD